MLSGKSALLTLSQTTNLDSSKLNEFADNDFKFVENGRKLSKQVENLVGKGEIARYERLVFKRLVLQTRKNQGLFGKGLRNLKEIYCPNKVAKNNFSYDNKSEVLFTGSTLKR